MLSSIVKADCPFPKDASEEVGRKIMGNLKLGEPFEPYSLLIVLQPPRHPFSESCECMGYDR